MPDGPRTFAARWLGPWVRELDGATVRRDGLAGLLAAVLVLPPAVAFAALAGVPPAMGLATAALPCAVAALAGSSRQMLSGPTNATSLALGAMLLPLAGTDPARLAALAVAVTLLVGAMQLALAFARLGVLANFISPAVMLGFTSGAALLIGWHALGAMVGAHGREAWWQVLQAHPGWPAPAVAGLTLAVAVLLRKVSGRTAAGGGRLAAMAPLAPLLALLAGGTLAWLLVRAGHPLPRLGTPPDAWQGWRLPPLEGALLPQLLPISLALTIIALGQSMSLAKLLATRTGAVVDANRECRGQGLANVVGAFAGCFVACGSINRSLPNLEAGARTPLAGVVAGFGLLVLVAAAGPLLAWIPLPAVGALLLLVALSLLDAAAWRRLWWLDRREAGIALATCAATLVLRLEVAVLTGVMLSLVVYLYRTSKPAMRKMGFDRPPAGAATAGPTNPAATAAAAPPRPFVVLDDHPAALPECPQLKLLRMEGSVWFGAVPHVAEQLRGWRERPAPQRHLLVMSKSMNFIDLAAADLWDDERVRRRAMGGDLYFHRPRPPVLATWAATGFLGRLGDDHVFADKRSAIACIVPRLDDTICANCRVRLFEECAARPGPPAGSPPVAV